MSIIPPPNEGHFTNILRNSLCRETTAKANCQGCNKLTPFTSRRRYGVNRGSPEAGALPPVLSINASLISDEHLEYWRDNPVSRSKHGRKRFLPDSLRVRVGDNGNMQIYDEQDIEPEQAGDIHYIVRVSSGGANQRVLCQLIGTFQ